jgi:spore cortex formation protein SpoVR/YcgB (stage V sporulation)
MFDQGLVNESFMMESLQSHTNVVYQPPFDSQYYSGINPYALGYNMMQDIRRLCENPTEEDKFWFPDFAGTSWLETLDFAMRNFKDESFVSQFLSPKLMRDFRLFSLVDDDQSPELEINAIHNDDGYRDIRRKLSEQYNLSSNEPNIQVYNVNLRGDRALTLRHVEHNRRPLDEKMANEMLKHIFRLWDFPVILESVTPNGEVMQTFRCPPEAPKPD